MDEASFSVGSWCFLTNCQSMQEISAPESTSATVSMVFKVCDGETSCTGILIDFGEQDMRTREMVFSDRLWGVLGNIWSMESAREDV